jgi:hypothetical protein
MPIGRLMMKIQCQLIASVRMPPASRPIEPLGEHRHDHAEDHGRGERAADPLHEAGADQHLLALRGGAGQGGGGEDGEAGKEDAALADEVADPPGQEQQAAEGDHVGVDDPGQLALAEAEVVLDRRQGDVDDGRVEDDHQHPRAEHVERQPAGAVVVLLSRGGGHVE